MLDNLEYGKLYPLRRFANKERYSALYLSLLVQRGKLRANRIGRNFFTTREWFEEYLERHARQDKRFGLKENNYIKNPIDNFKPDTAAADNAGFFVGRTSEPEGFSEQVLAGNDSSFTPSLHRQASQDQSLGQRQGGPGHLVIRGQGGVLENSGRGDFVFASQRRLIIFLRSTAISMAIILLGLFLYNFFNVKADSNGRVAGAAEKIESISDEGELGQSIVKYKDRLYKVTENISSQYDEPVHMMEDMGE